jgi:DNA-binding GntR family transcriptional regulator
MNTITRHDFHGWKAALRTTNRPHKTVAEHDRIIEAIAAGDAKKARSAMRSHLLAARRNLGLSGFK